MSAELHEPGRACPASSIIHHPSPHHPSPHHPSSSPSSIIQSIIHHPVHHPSSIASSPCGHKSSALHSAMFHGTLVATKPSTAHRRQFNEPKCRKKQSQPKRRTQSTQRVSLARVDHVVGSCSARSVCSVQRVRADADWSARMCHSVRALTLVRREGKGRRETCERCAVPKALLSIFTGRSILPRHCGLS
jgi:hypothetical protein